MVLDRAFAGRVAVEPCFDVEPVPDGADVELEERVGKVIVALSPHEDGAALDAGPFGDFVHADEEFEVDDGLAHRSVCGAWEWRFGRAGRVFWQELVGEALGGAREGPAPRVAAAFADEREFSANADVEWDIGRHEVDVQVWPLVEAEGAVHAGRGHYSSSRS